MKKTFVLPVIAGLAFAPAAFADTDTVYHSKASNVEEDANGNLNASTSRNRVDADGNSVSVDTGVSADAQGNASVSKRVERDQADAFGTTKRVMPRSADTNGNQKVSRYEEERNDQ